MSWSGNKDKKRGQRIIVPENKLPVFLGNYQYIIYEDIEVKPD
jgi:hypothetical protein